MINHARANVVPSQPHGQVVTIVRSHTRALYSGGAFNLTVTESKSPPRRVTKACLPYQTRLPWALLRCQHESGFSSNRKVAEELRGCDVTRRSPSPMPPGADC